MAYGVDQRMVSDHISAMSVRAVRSDPAPTTSCEKTSSSEPRLIEALKGLDGSSVATDVSAIESRPLVAGLLDQLEDVELYSTALPRLASAIKSWRSTSVAVTSSPSPVRRGRGHPDRAAARRRS